MFKLAIASEVQYTLGQRLRLHRLAQSLSQTELAGMAGLSTGAIRKLERDGQTSLETLIRVAQTLGLVQEFDGLFEYRHTSIAQMERAEQAKQRQRAPRRSGASHHKTHFNLGSGGEP